MFRILAKRLIAEQILLLDKATWPSRPKRLENSLNEPNRRRLRVSDPKARKATRRVAPPQALENLCEYKLLSGLFAKATKQKVGHPPTGTFAANWGLLTHPSPPSGLGRNQLQLLNNTPIAGKRQCGQNPKSA